MASRSPQECNDVLAWTAGCVALVTGAGIRLGKAIAASLHTSGYKVAVHYNGSKDEAIAFTAELNSAFAVHADLSTSIVETSRRLVAAVVDKWGRLDLLVNSAAIYYATPIADTTEEQWDNLMNLNTKAPYFVTQVLLSSLVTQVLLSSLMNLNKAPYFVIQVLLSSHVTQVLLSSLVTQVLLSSLMNLNKAPYFVIQVLLSSHVTQVLLSSLVTRVLLSSLVTQVLLRSHVTQVLLSSLVTRVLLRSLVTQVLLSSLVTQVLLRSHVTQVLLSSLVTRVLLRTLVTQVLLSSLVTRVLLRSLVTQAAAPHLKETRGSVVNVADILGERPNAPFNVYCISKATMIMITKSLALELAPDVRVNYVNPGASIFPDDYDEKLKQIWKSRTPLGRAGSGKEVGDSVLFLASPSASFMTGAAVTPSGGRSIAL
ncbi:Pteridine reductase 1 [Chionoecetes opilio]|uniref:Pteridine reductase 1 n=1 Tax=Chionoecetes opilio TaxID=41210 RepID=A0A8J5CLY9_CHIOP|nr:Pteridine reductase 1 [Chionoecetes opilio]